MDDIELQKTYVVIISHVMIFEITLNKKCSFILLIDISSISLEL